MRTFRGHDGTQFLDSRELGLRARWFHYSTTEVYSRFFRTPDWRLWQQGRFEDAIASMLADTATRQRSRDRAAVWHSNGVWVIRAQVVDREASSRIEHPVNYLMTYLEVTNPSEDRLVIDAAKSTVVGEDLPDFDFVLHDDDLVMTKYEGEPGVLYRDAYVNVPPADPADPADHDEPDDRPFWQRCRDLADRLVERRDALAYDGVLPGLELLRQVRARENSGS